MGGGSVVMGGGVVVVVVTADVVIVDVLDASGAATCTTDVSSPLVFSSPEIITPTAKAIAATATTVAVAATIAKFRCLGK